MSENRPARASSKEMLVVGIGNLLLADEGFGVHLVRRLHAEGVPEGVVVVDGGTRGIDLLDRLCSYRRIILIDAIRVRASISGDPTVRGRDSDEPRDQRSGAQRPGTFSSGQVVVFRLSNTDIMNPDPTFSLHESSLGSLLNLGRTLGYDFPPITVVGFVPSEIGWSTELSPSGRRAIEEALRLVRQEIAEETAFA